MFIPFEPGEVVLLQGGLRLLLARERLLELVRELQGILPLAAPVGFEGSQEALPFLGIRQLIVDRQGVGGISLLVLVLPRARLILQQPQHLADLRGLAPLTLCRTLRAHLYRWEGRS